VADSGLGPTRDSLGQTTSFMVGIATRASARSSVDTLRSGSNHFFAKLGRRTRQSGVCGSKQGCQLQQRQEDGCQGRQHHGCCFDFFLERDAGSGRLQYGRGTHMFSVLFIMDFNVGTTLVLLLLEHSCYALATTVLAR